MGVKTENFYLVGCSFVKPAEKPSWRQNDSGSSSSLERLSHPPEEGVMTYLQKAPFNTP